VAKSSRYARGTRHTPGGTDLEPLSRRALQAAGVLSLLLILVVANSLINGSGGGNPFNPVAAAAEHAEDVPGARFSLYVVYSSPATTRSIAAGGSGVFNTETERSRLTLDLDGPATGSIHLVQITDGDSEYTGGDTVAAELPPGKQWVRTEKGSAQEGETPLDTDDSLKMLSSSGEVKLIGHESIDGKTTKHYRGEISLVDFVEYLREHGKDEVADAYERVESVAPTQISAECWVDGKNLLRRLRIVMPMPGKVGQPPLTVDMRMDFFAYGVHPDIQVPDPDSVVEGPLDSGAEPTSSSIS
jgi:hypothetical protein